MRLMFQPNFPRAVLFDLLTALIDSWTLWNPAAGSERAGRAWRAEYLRPTYGCGAYAAHEDLVREAARTTGRAEAAPDYLESYWSKLAPWSGAQATLDALQGRCKLAVVTNARPGSARSPPRGSRRAGMPSSPRRRPVSTNPIRAPYRLALERLGVPPEQAAFVAGSAFDLDGTAAAGFARLLAQPGRPAASRATATARYRMCDVRAPDPLAGRTGLAFKRARRRGLTIHCRRTDSSKKLLCNSSASRSQFAPIQREPCRQRVHNRTVVGWSARCVT